MEKATSSFHESALPAPLPTIADEKPRIESIKRKPLATPSSAYKQPTLLQKEIQSSPPYRNDFLPSSLPAPAQRRHPALIARLRTRWAMFSRRTRILIVAGIICVVALIIGLSAGLASRSRTSNLPLPSNHGGPFTGDLTYYDPALGACGYTNDGSDAICAVSHFIFDAVSVGSNPNANPLCGKKIRARRNGKSIDLTVVDRCVGCQPTDIDTTRSVFADLASIDDGRVPVDWSWLEDVPGAAAGG
ncbi:hypothetical protein H2198_006974 [Neophaeococcomyces mojaviensis]|uniref:Uncharacterized protein n=1 Tax=Neophaeococcomyces mojaviensis TaxID=3383035 RepID=A0ACC3A1C5_9EURO|nr:hypothetical protein H2198_006974 [Knufia sp. JES_112]